MNRRTNASMVALCVAVAVLSSAAGSAARDVSTVMRLMPDDLTVSVVNVEKYVRSGVKFFYTHLNGWILSGGQEFLAALRGDGA